MIFIELESFVTVSAAPLATKHVYRLPIYTSFPCFPFWKLWPIFNFLGSFAI